MAYVPKIDKGACIAQGDCVDEAPGVFELEGDSTEVIGSGSDKLILRAAEACPTLAITVIDDETGETIYP